ncbi:PH domain-containing protein [Streptomyces sp. NBS 14/10]|uniref:PH domain-containing protein n=1 Tax=Streptomyces sp. NBS 14/10 TaxID=1945643 RepID=UPI000B7E9446|nr:PH domain-containing protein [Streptomyces sp. NBS 14/10]KAK1179795.1 PH domain-containing protein [Streptomyces sp. NBS 14/10]
MTSHDELWLRMVGKSARWTTAMAALAAVAAGIAASLGAPDAEKLGILSGTVGVAAVGFAVGGLRRRVEAGPDGLRIREILRWRRLGWDEIVRLEDLWIAADPRARSGQRLRVAARLRDDSLVWLPVPFVGAVDVAGFERELAQLRALHRRYTRGTQGS